jgi:hypothetical protein
MTYKKIVWEDIETALELARLGHDTLLVEVSGVLYTVYFDTVVERLSEPCTACGRDDKITYSRKCAVIGIEDATGGERIKRGRGSRAIMRKFGRELKNEYEHDFHPPLCMVCEEDYLNRRL